MSPIGQRLRRGREEKGASRVDVSQETKIAVHHLAALEYSDFKELPDVVHVKGYVRAYAEYLGLEPTAVLEEFLAEYEAQCPAANEDPRDEVVRKMSKMLGGSQGQWARGMRPVAIAGALLLVVVLVWTGWRWLGPDGETDAGATEVAQVEPATVEADEPATPEPAGAEETARAQEPDPQRYVVFREPEAETPATSTEAAAERTTSPPAEASSERTASPPAEASSERTTSPPAEASSERTASSPAEASSERATSPPAEVAAETVTQSPKVTTAELVTPAPVTDARLRITQHGVGTGVESRQLRGESDRFALGTKVAFFTRVEGGRAGDSIRHVWRHEGNRITSIPLRIGSANWRTYSMKTMFAGSAGAWTVEAVDEDGNVLARSEFDCRP